MIEELMSLSILIFINLLFGIIFYRTRYINGLKVSLKHLLYPAFVGIVFIIGIFYFNIVSDGFLFLLLGMHFGMIFSLNLIVGGSADKEVIKDQYDDERLDHRELPMQGKE